MSLFLRVLHKDHWTNFDQCGPMWSNGDADHLQLAKITTKWLQSGKSADSQLQICNSAPRTAANVPITCWQASSSARDSTDNRGQGARPGLTPTWLLSMHLPLIASYCLYCPHHSLASYSSFTSPPLPVKGNWNTTLVRSLYQQEWQHTAEKINWVFWKIGKVGLSLPQR